jgi:hypothetical protein
MNNRRDRLVKPQLTSNGVEYVPLFYDGYKHGISIKVLVAKAFVEGETKIFDTPINKDGDKRNNRVENLVWRPRWYAINYSRQFRRTYLHETAGPVYDVDTGERFETVRDAAVANGLLFKEVFRSVYSGTPVLLTNQKFRIPDSIQVR